MWDQLRPAEKTRLIHLLVQSIEYDEEAGEISITYYPGALENITNQEVANA